MPDSQEKQPNDPGPGVDQPLTLSHFVHVLRAYSPVILIAVAGIMILYAVVAAGIYLWAPSQEVTAVPFRLEFEGASEGQYPNKTKFSAADVVSTPILLKVYQDNHLDRFTDFPALSRSVLVLQDSRAADELAVEYQRKLADTRLSPADRDRIQRELEQKRAALPKSEYAIFFIKGPDTRKIPDMMIRKVLMDTLSQWAHDAVFERRALQYQVSVLSPDSVTRPAGEREDYIVSIQVLRSKIRHLMDNVDDIKRLPGGNMVRTRDDHISLQEIRFRLVEITRYRLEPLVGLASASGLIKDRPAAIRFVQSQLAYDQRTLKALQETAESIRQSLTAYLGDKPTAEAQLKGAGPKTENAGSASGIAPVLSESFLDRLVTLSSLATDARYRQKLADDYQTASLDIVPAEQAVSYDLDVLNEIKNPSQSASSDPAAVKAQIDETRREVHDLAIKTNELYQTVSANLNPATQFFTADSPYVRTERGISLARLALIGLAVLLLSIPVVVALCLLHNRLREEDRQNA